MPRITPFMIPTKGSRRPKSVVSVMIGVVPETPLPLAIAVHDEVRDQPQRLLVLGVLERAQRLLGGLGVLVGPLERVVGALVLHHQTADLLDLVGVQGMAPEQRLDALALVRGRAPERRDQRQRALAFLEVRPDGLAEAGLVGDEVERVVAGLERDGDIEPVAGEALDLLSLTPAGQGPDAAASGRERRGLLGGDPHGAGLA